MVEQLTQFHFLRPQLLLLGIPLFLLIALVKSRRFKSGMWGRVCDEHLLPFLLIGQGNLSSRWALIRLALVGLAVITAFAGPTWEKLPQPVFRSQAALVVVLDLSRSMDVTDIKPSRVARARHKILDILKQRKEGQTALIVYAAEAFVVTPLTEDTNTVASLVKNLSTDLMPYQGSHPEKAIVKAAELFKQASVLNGHVLLITDGVESPDMGDAVAEFTKAGHRLSILGVGTEQGAPIADYRGGFVKNQDGSIVIARLEEPLLKTMAADGGGIYQSLTANDRDINNLLDVLSESRFDETMKDQSSKMKLRSDQWREEGPWILLLLLPFVALVFRRGYLILLVAILVPVPQTSYAFDWSTLWKNQNQRAQTALAEGNSQQAAELFQDPEWKAAANYRAQHYQQSIESLNSINTPDALYNKGNALAKMGDLQQAIQTYEQALKMNPNHQDAKYNRDLLKEYLKKNQDQQNQDQQNSEQDQQNDQQDKQSSNQQNDQQDKQQQNSSEDNPSSQADKGNDEQQNKQSDNQNEENLNQQKNDQQKDDQNESQEKDTQQAEKEQQERQEQQSQQAAQQNNDDKNDKEGKSEAQMEDRELTDDEKKISQQTEQWLRRIPDDPGGLLRRKFRYQSELDSRQAQEEPKPW